MQDLKPLVEHVRRYPHWGVCVKATNEEGIYWNKGGFRSFRSHETYSGIKGLRIAVQLAKKFNGIIGVD